MVRRILLASVVAAGLFTNAASAQTPHSKTTVKKVTPVAGAKYCEADCPQEGATENGEWKLGLMVRLAPGGGSRVVEVFTGSPAEQMQLQAGDTLISVNGSLANDLQKTRRQIFEADAVKLVIRRGNQYYEADVEFDAQAGAETVAYGQRRSKSIKKSTLKSIPAPRR